MKKQPKDGIRITGRIFAWFSATACLLPVVIVISVATTNVWQQGPWAGGFTLKWLVNGWTTISPYAFYSIKLAFFILVLNYIIGFPTSWIIARYRFPGRNFLYSMTNVPIAIPGIAMGLALIITYPMLRKSGILLVAGHLLYTLPYFISNITPQLADQGLKDVEAVAKTLGASFIKRFFFIVVPRIKTAILAATILVVTLSMGEFNVAFFLFNPKTKPLPVELYSSYITGRIEFAAAITLCFLCFVIPAGILLEHFGGVKVGNKNVE